MPPTELHLPVDDGALAALDFGGRGTPVVLVHGSGHDAAAWTDVAARLVAHCRPLAVDLRGHGQTRLDSGSPEQYWRDLGPACRTLGAAPLLVGHSTGGYAVTAATAAGLVEPLALCVVDGFVLDSREESARSHAAWQMAEAAEKLRALFRYGWSADEAERDAWIETRVRDAPTDWLDAGGRPELVREVARRSFLRAGERWVRRPTIEEIMAAARPDPAAAVYPALELYDAVHCPLALVVATRGFYARREAELRRVLEGGRDRFRVDVDSGHNVPMTRPEALADVVLDLLRRFVG